MSDENVTRALTCFFTCACCLVFAAQSFFVFDSDPVPIRQFKLEILTYIASENNIGRILREFNVYVHKEEKEFVTATIQVVCTLLLSRLSAWKVSSCGTLLLLCQA